MFHDGINRDYISLLMLARSRTPVLHQRLYEGITYTSEIIKHSAVEEVIRKKASNSPKIFAQAVYVKLTFHGIDSMKAAVVDEMHKLGFANFS